MQPFKQLSDRAVPMPIEHVDTDQIIPARFLKAIDKVGFGENLFRDWRYSKGEEKIPHFVLNNELYNGQILVAGKNFGCGSSREHAAWALYQYGFRVVVSSFFADIFKNNALNNGILPVAISESFLDEIFKTIEKNPKATFTVDLPAQSIIIDASTKQEFFDIDPYKKQCLLEGKDDIDYLLSLDEEIRAFDSAQVIF